MILDQTTDRQITSNLLLEEEHERKNHKKSGKLAASQLGDPTLWQVLEVLGIPDKPFDPYTLRKFKRGDDVEAWLVPHLKGVIETQKKVTYKGVNGKIDALIDSKGYEFECGIIPHEIKSVANMKYRRINKAGEADPKHKLQGGLYALAENTEYYAIDYVASDDYRIKTMIYPTSDIADEINQIINDFDTVFKTKKIPVFSPRYKWQENPMYEAYSDWNKLTADQIILKLTKEFPEQFKSFLTLK